MMTIMNIAYGDDDSFQVGAAEFARAHAPPGAVALFLRNYLQ